MEPTLLKDTDLPGRICLTGPDLAVPELPVYLAVLAHSPEDTAVGTGRTAKEAQAALVAAYPPAAGKTLDIVVISLGKGVASLEAAAEPGQP